MYECIDTNKVCSNTNKKCKECILDSCKGAIKMLEIQERNIRKEKEEKIRKQLPRECRECSILEIIDNKVYCFYRNKDKCIISGTKHFKVGR